MLRNCNVQNPWIQQRADPYVYKHKDGNYYFTASVPTYDRLVLRKSDTLDGLSKAPETVIWTKHEEGIMGAHIWAPELHYLKTSGISIFRLEMQKIHGMSVLMFWNAKTKIH